MRFRLENSLYEQYGWKNRVGIEEAENVIWKMRAREHAECRAGIREELQAPGQNLCATLFQSVTAGLPLLRGLRRFWTPSSVSVLATFGMLVAVLGGWVHRTLIVGSAHCLGKRTAVAAVKSQSRAELSQWEIIAMNASSPLEDNTQLVTIGRRYKMRAQRCTLFKLSVYLLFFYMLLSSQSTQTSGFLKTKKLMDVFSGALSGANTPLLAVRREGDQRLFFE
ncbi:hypothetical protein DPX16_22449 [Anabarilius grahami]|uniref:Uncharacterized protein n=1 Tax=Anabarilius grahami TaxID=495550 RepID=A0A3N0YZH8_ANAGA|nr:hypothetical protein DPX16_22449 [Anabarilius grahami]